jgi:hypothetical protein
MTQMLPPNVCVYRSSLVETMESFDEIKMTTQQKRSSSTRAGDAVRFDFRDP